MKISSHKITGILLAGGMSSRMGHDKGSMMIGGRMMYEYPLQALESVCDEILISSSRPLPGDLHYPVVCDEISGIGPMGGIHAALERSSNELNLVISYDLPLVNEGLLKFLVGLNEGWDVVLPAIQGGQPEPLCALYRKSMRPVFDALIEEGRYAVHLALPLVRSLVVDILPGMQFYRRDLFLNINRMEDLESLPENFGY